MCPQVNPFGHSLHNVCITINKLHLKDNFFQSRQIHFTRDSFVDPHGSQIRIQVRVLLVGNLGSLPASAESSPLRILLQGFQRFRNMFVVYVHEVKNFLQLFLRVGYNILEENCQIIQILVPEVISYLKGRVKYHPV